HRSFSARASGSTKTPAASRSASTSSAKATPHRPWTYGTDPPRRRFRASERPSDAVQGHDTPRTIASRSRRRTEQRRGGVWRRRTRTPRPRTSATGAPVRLEGVSGRDHVAAKGVLDRLWGGGDGVGRDPIAVEPLVLRRRTGH